MSVIRESNMLCTTCTVYMHNMSRLTLEKKRGDERHTEEGIHEAQKRNSYFGFEHGQLKNGMSKEFAKDFPFLAQQYKCLHVLRKSGEQPFVCYIAMTKAWPMSLRILFWWSFVNWIQ